MKITRLVNHLVIASYIYNCYFLKSVMPHCQMMAIDDVFYYWCFDVFIFRAFLDINPEKGSKAKKTPKPCNINSKVRKLITKLAAFRWLVEA